MSPRAWKPNSKRWEVAAPFEGAEQLARQISAAPLVAQILANRGVTEPDAAKAFLQPKLSDLHDPAGLPGTLAAAERIARAVADKEKIVIYGDYDVDGITAIAIMHSVLKLVDADVDFYVPHRLEEGYGVNSEALTTIIADGAKLLITVDCGVTAVGPLAEATAAGLDVIVTDHHSLGDALPDVTAIVHPRLEGSEYPNGDLAGAGVAFKLAWQVARTICGSDRVDEPMRDFLLDATCLAALGTIADVVPLVGENRCLAVHGLRGLPATKHPGLRALIEACNLTDKKLDAFHVGFVLAPRINACGRMGHARLAVELLTDTGGTNASRHKQTAEYLGSQNTARQKVERAITAEAIEMVEARGLNVPESKAIVLWSDKWHAGVIGICASRMVDRFSRPALLIAVNDDGCGQGSGRSIPGFHMRDALAACGEHLASFGGHAMAGGVRVKLEDIEAFAEAFRRYAAEHVSADKLTPALAVDAEVSLAEISYKVAEYSERLAPFGQGNPQPLLAIRNCSLLAAPKRMGRSGGTVSLVLGQDGTRLRAVGFGMGDLADHLVGVNTIDVVGQPVLNSFNGRTTVELQLADVKW